MNTATPLVTFAGVQKTYDGRTVVVRELNLDIRRGEFLTLLGAFACSRAIVCSLSDPGRARH